MVLRHLEVIKSEASHDKRLIHYLQHEVTMLKDIEGVKEKDLGYIVSIGSGVDVAPKRLRTVCGWAFGFSHFQVSSVSLSGAVICGRVFKTKEELSSSQRNTEQLFEFFRAV